MRFAIALLAVLLLTPIVRAGDVAAVKQAYMAYTQARIDNNADAAKANSFGEAGAAEFIPVEMELHTVRRKVMDEMARLSGREVKPRDAKAAADEANAMVETATITVDGDNATLVPKGFSKGYRLRKIDGKWRYDLESMDHAPWKQQLQIAERTLPLMKSIAAKIDAGEYKTAEQLQAAMDAMQREFRAAAAATTTKPATQPK